MPPISEENLRFRGIFSKILETFHYIEAFCESLYYYSNNPLKIKLSTKFEYAIDFYKQQTNKLLILGHLNRITYLNITELNEKST